MKLARSIILTVLLGGVVPSVVYAQLQVLAGQPAQHLFGGTVRKVDCHWHNAGGAAANIEIRAVLSQTSSTTVAPVLDEPWKKIEVLPGQTVEEIAVVDFPAVRAKTQFLIQWIENSHHVLGETRVLIYPTNLLEELGLMLGEDKFGVLDPSEALKPSLSQNGVKFLDLGGVVLKDFGGKLAVVGPFQSATQVREGLPQTIQHLAKKGVAVVWIEPSSAPGDAIIPTFYVVPEGKGSVVVVQPELVADFSENPRSQLNLVYFCRLALNPVPLPLPNLLAQP